MAARPSVVILAGPNGAGKSTAAPLLLGEARLHAQVFVNADEIAAERSPADPAGAAIAAGREMLSRLHALAPLATRWQMYDSSVGGAPRLIVTGSAGLVGSVSDPATWAEIQRGAYGRSG